MKISRGRQIGFGWKHSTHQLITGTVAKQINEKYPHEIRLDMETILEGCIAPDFARKKKEKYIHGHFANIDKISSDPPDAYNLFLIYSQKAIRKNKEALTDARHYLKRDKYLGYALHFLQDMLNPFHVKYRPLPPEHPERIFHRRFEQMAEKYQTPLVENLAAQKVDYEGVDNKIFVPQAMRKTKELHKHVKNFEYKGITDVLKTSLENTYLTTDLYLNRIFQIFEESYNSSIKKKSEEIIIPRF